MAPGDLDPHYLVLFWQQLFRRLAALRSKRSTTAAHICCFDR